MNDLSPREVDVLALSALGYLDKQIAAELGVTLWTIQDHHKNAKRKLAARTKAHAVALAIRSGAIQEDTP